MRSKIVFEDAADDSLNNLAVVFSISGYKNHPKFIQQQIDKFLTRLVSLVGAYTDVNYHAAQGSVDGITYINLHSNIGDTEDAVQKRVESIIDYVQSIDFSKQQTHIIQNVNMLVHNNVNFNKAFSIAVINKVTRQFYMHPITIPLKHPHEYSRFNVKRVKEAENGTITYVSDSCTSNYGLFMNLSMKFEDMGMSYNALHLYEHLMMKCFKNLDLSAMLEANGATYPNGICYVYTIHKTKESLKMYLEQTMKVLHEIRQEGYWKQDSQRDEIKFETKRTISETRMSRSLTDFGRTDINAYKDGYKTEIFDFWSNLPFDVIVTGPDVGPEMYDFGDLPHKYPRRLNVKRPANIKHKIIPIDVLRSKEYSKSLTQRMTPMHIKELFMSPFMDPPKNVHTILEDGGVNYGVYGYLYGLDSCVVCLSENLTRYNSTAMPIVFFNRYYTEKELENVLNKSNIPTDASMYTAQKFFI